MAFLLSTGAIGAKCNFIREREYSDVLTNWRPIAFEIA
jgi:hypothetical protein